MVVVLSGVVAVGLELLGQNQELTGQGCTDRLSIRSWDVREREELGVVPRFLAGFIGRLGNRALPVRWRLCSPRHSPSESSQPPEAGQMIIHEETDSE